MEPANHEPRRGCLIVPLLYPYTFHQMNGSARRQGSARRRAARALAAGGSRYGPEVGAGVPPMRTQTPGHQPQTWSSLARAAATAATTAATTTTAGGTPADAAHAGPRDGPRARRVQVAEHGQVPPAEGPTWDGGDREGAPWHALRESQARRGCAAAQCRQPVKANASATAIVYPSQPSKGPATFQEMGYHSQTLDKKECIIM